MKDFDIRIKNSWIKMNFVKRYEELSKKFDAVRTPSDEQLRQLDRKLVMEMIQDLGYVPQYDGRERFFKIKEEQVDPFAFGVHMILKYGLVELVWVVREKGVVLLGDPWSVYSRRLIDPDYRIKMPIFGDYDDLEEILKISFDMYEDFKRAMISNNGECQEV